VIFFKEKNNFNIRAEINDRRVSLEKKIQQQKIS